MIFDLQHWRSHGRAFAAQLGAGFARHDGMQNAAALTYTTLLSLVPLMTVTIAVFSAFPVADKVYQGIQDFMFQNFVPASGEVLQQYLQQFSEKASRLTGVGFIFLVVVALMMMSTIDRAINATWEVKKKRRLANKFLIYWAVLSLGPILIGASVVVTSYIISLPILSDAVSTGFGRRLLGLTPVAASTLAFAMLFTVVPNRKVKLKHAFIGGFVSALLFEFAKRAFGWYVTTFPTYEAIYGALATVPIFLVWIYLSWVVVLLGAEFTHTLSNYRWNVNERSDRQLNIHDAIRLMLILDDASASGKGLKLEQIQAMHPLWSERQLETYLPELREIHLVHLSEEGTWVAARRLSDFTLHDLYLAKPFLLPSEEQIDGFDDQRLQTLFKQANGEVEKVLNVPLSEFRAR